MRLEVAVFALALAVLAFLNHGVDCSPQLTFSTDWSGGRRETSNDDADLLQFDSNSDLSFEKRRPGWGKRAPGWGKRSESEAHELTKLRLTNLYKDFERKAAEIKKILEALEAEK